MTENNWSNSFIFAAAFYVCVNRVVLSFSPECPSSSLISETPLIVTAPLWRTSSLLLSTMKGDLRTAHRFPSLLSSQCTLIFLLPSEQWSHGVPSISLLQMHPLVQILNTACFSNKLFSRSFPISWAWSGIYCYLPSPPARPSLLLHKTQGIIKCGTGGQGDFHFFSNSLQIQEDWMLSVAVSPGQPSRCSAITDPAAPGPDPLLSLTSTSSWVPSWALKSRPSKQLILTINGQTSTEPRYLLFPHVESQFSSTLCSSPNTKPGACHSQWQHFLAKLPAVPHLIISPTPFSTVFFLFLLHPLFISYFSS